MDMKMLLTESFASKCIQKLSLTFFIATKVVLATQYPGEHHSTAKSSHPSVQISSSWNFIHNCT